METAEATEAEVTEVESDSEEELASALSLPGAGKPPLDVREIPLDQIAERENIRIVYHGIEGLAETMHLQGQLQPCRVRPSPADADHGREFELIFGFRRKRAAEYLREQGIEGWDSLRCEVRDAPDDAHIEEMIVENFQREDPSAVAEARAMYQLKNSKTPSLSNAEVARRLGCDPSQVSHRLKLLSLAPPQRPTRPVAPVVPVSVDDDGPDPDVPSPSDNEPLAESAGGGSKAKTTKESPVHVSQAEEDSDHQEPLALEAANEQTEAEEAPTMDILDMVDKGELSASMAEVVAGLDDQDQREKLVTLAKRHDWSVKKAANWARQVKEHELDEGSDKMGPIEMVTIDDVVELDHLKLRADISDEEVARITVYAQLRNGMDQQILDWLAEELGFPYENLWGYVTTLSDDQIKTLNRRLALRFVSASHRWYDLEPELKTALGAQEETISEDELDLPEDL